MRLNFRSQVHFTSSALNRLPQPPEALKLDRLGLKSRGGLPVELKDLPVDYDSLLQAGSIMGSGGMIVMDDHDCVVDLARYFLRFLQEESCGKCLPCTMGLNGMLEFLDRFAKGQGTPQDLGELESLAQAIVDGSLCGLGGTAPNPVLTSIRYFKDEYLAHIQDHKCPAGVCRDLITYAISPEVCNGCGMCANVCPHGVFAVNARVVTVIRREACMECGACLLNCPVGAIKVDSGVGCAAAMMSAALKGRKTEDWGSNAECACG